MKSSWIYIEPYIQRLVSLSEKRKGYLRQMHKGKDRVKMEAEGSDARIGVLEQTLPCLRISPSL